MTTRAELPRQEIAGDALESIRKAVDGADESDGASTGLAQNIRDILEVAEARLRMAAMRRNRRAAHWLAGVTSFSFPRTFKRGWESKAANYICFTVEITDGAKSALGRTVEVQVPDKDAVRLAEQIIRMDEARKRRDGEAGA